MTMLAKAGAFELHQGGTPNGFVVRTRGYPRNCYSILWRGDGIAMGDHAKQLHALAPHIFKWAEAQINQLAAVPLSGTDSNDQFEHRI